jgi:mono/diheme cytochrome c family protein
MTRLFVCLCLAALLASCDDMSRQAKFKAGHSAPLFASGRADNGPPPGTVAVGQLANEALLTQRPPMSRELLDRGEQRYRIYCTPCHGVGGQGDGLVVGRGFSKPPALDSEGSRALTDQQLLTLIAEGRGQMAGFAMQLPAPDRWAVVAHIRALQLSQHAPVAQLPTALRDQLP